MFLIDFCFYNISQIGREKKEQIDCKLNHSHRKSQSKVHTNTIYD